MCKHLRGLDKPRSRPVTPSALGCEDCLALGQPWVHLRLCLECGHVGCCDSSPNRHATSHFQDTKHPIVKSFEPGEDWAWCYVHEDMVETIRAFPIESPSEHHAPPQAAP